MFSIKNECKYDLFLFSPSVTFVLSILHTKVVIRTSVYLSDSFLILFDCSIEIDWHRDGFLRITPKVKL